MLVLKAPIYYTIIFVTQTRPTLGPIRGGVSLWYKPTKERKGEKRGQLSTGRGFGRQDSPDCLGNNLHDGLVELI